MNEGAYLDKSIGGVMFAKDLITETEKIPDAQVELNQVISVINTLPRIPFHDAHMMKEYQTIDSIYSLIGLLMAVETHTRNRIIKTLKETYAADQTVVANHDKESAE